MNDFDFALGSIHKTTCTTRPFVVVDYIDEASEVQPYRVNRFRKLEEAEEYSKAGDFPGFSEGFGSMRHWCTTKLSSNVGSFERIETVSQKPENEQVLRTEDLNLGDVVQLSDGNIGVIQESVFSGLRVQIIGEGGEIRYYENFDRSELAVGNLGMSRVVKVLSASGEF